MKKDNMKLRYLYKYTKVRKAVILQELVFYPKWDRFNVKHCEYFMKFIDFSLNEKCKYLKIWKAEIKRDELRAPAYLGFKNIM